MKKLAVFLTLIVVPFLNGCGIISVIGNPTRYERKVPAEYDLTRHKDPKILVLVSQPAYINAQVNLRLHLTERINSAVKKDVKIPPENLIGYSELSEFRSNKSDFSLLTPTQIGKALQADLVLWITIEDYQLLEIPDADYYKGHLDTRAVLLDTVTAGRLWPESTESRDVKVGFEVESRGREVAVDRLAAASAHCIVRYFYDCPKNRFKIGDDKSGSGWKSWGK